MEKNPILVLMILALLLAAFPVCGQSAENVVVPLDIEAEEIIEEPEPLPDYSYDELTVGNTTQLEGNFYTDMWGDNTADLDVRMLLHGCSLVSWENEHGAFIFDPTVVNGSVVMDNAEGDRTYLISLYSDLLYSDGSPIRAQDYIFTILLGIAPEISELGGNPLHLAYIKGYEDYVSGASSVLSGIRLLDDSQFSVTIRHEYLPFFYELGLLYFTPTPISVVAPDCVVADNGEGAFIDGHFSADLLRRTLLDPETGYVSHPSVTSGPYMLTGWDGEKASFLLNPNYKGDEEGNRPHIKRLVYKLAENGTMMDELKNGNFGLLNKVTLKDVIDAGFRLTSDGLYGMSNYPRTGLTFIAFAAERPAVSSLAVRQAIAYSLDKDALVRDYVGNYGLRTDGFYGLGQWMYQIVSKALRYEIPEPENPTSEDLQQYNEALQRLDSLSLDAVKVYDPELDEAVALLARDGWTLNRNGEAFIRGTDDVRCKMINGELVALDLKLAYPAGNRIAVSMEENFLPHLADAGIKLTLEPKSMSEILDLYYRRTERDCDMIYLGTNFDIVFDISTLFTQDESGQQVWTYTGLADDELYDLAVALRQVAPGNVLNYCERWIQFQERFAEVLPMIPVYSNIYFDFYPRILQDYVISPHATWTEAIVAAHLDDVPDILPAADVTENIR